MLVSDGHHSAAARNPRSGISLIETLIVFVILAILLGMLFPAIQMARESARRVTCQSNLHQLAAAMQDMIYIHRKPPDPAQHGTTGGWCIEVLDFVEERNAAAGL